MWVCGITKYLLEKWEGRLDSCLFPTTLCPSSKPVWAEVFNFTYAARGPQGPWYTQKSILPCASWCWFSLARVAAICLTGMRAESAVPPAGSVWGKDRKCLVIEITRFFSLSSLQIPSESELAIFPLNFAPFAQAWKLPSEDHTKNIIWLASWVQPSEN